MATVCELRLEDLRISESQARRRDVEAGLDELVESIRLHGLLEPIVVCPASEDGKFEIVTGQRRFLAHQRLGRDTIFAHVLKGPLDATTTRVLSLTENVIRQDLSGKDLVDVCTALYRKYGSASAVAEETGIPYAKVLKYVKYDRLHPELRSLVDNGEVRLEVALKAQDLSTAPPHANRDPLVPGGGTEGLNGNGHGGAGGNGAVNGNGHRQGAVAVELAKQLTGLTKIQQRQVEREIHSSTAPIPGVISKVKGNNKPKQIVVTLTAAHHSALQVFASRKGLTQDVAAARLIVDGLRDFM